MSVSQLRLSSLRFETALWHGNSYGFIFVRVIELSSLKFSSPEDRRKCETVLIKITWCDIILSKILQ